MSARTPEPPAISVLLVVDSEDDAVLLESALSSGGLDARCERIASESQLVETLKRDPWDAVVCDRELTAFDSARALDVVRAHDQTLPFIVVSPSADEADVVDAMQGGAWSFVSRAQLRRLVPVLTRALDDASVRRENRDAHLRLTELAAIVESSQDAIFAKDPRGVITAWNRGAERLYGWSAAEAVGKSASMLVPDDRWGEEQIILERTAQGRTVPPYDTERVAKDGSVRHVSLTVSPLYERDVVVGASSIARDIGGRKRAEEALGRTEARYRALLEHLPDAMVVHFDTEGSVVFAAGRLLEKLGTSAEELAGSSVSEVVPDPRGDRVDEMYVSALRGLENSFVMPSQWNPDVILAYDAVPLYDSDGGVVGGMVVGRDITERVHSETELRAARELFEGAFEYAPVGMTMVGAEGAELGRFIRVNRAFSQMLGYPPHELIGKTPDDVTHPEDVNAMVPGMDEFLRGDTSELDRQKRYIRKDGSVAWGFLRAALVQGADGKPLYALAVIADITSRLEAEQEQERLETLLHQAQRLEGIGRLAGGVAHDFNNLLAVILNYAELAQIDAEGDVAEALGEIKWAAKRAAELTSQLLLFSRREIAQPVALDPNRLVAGIQSFLARTIGESVELETDLHPSTPNVRCDAMQFEQVLINLAVNARDAMPDGGRLRIDTRGLEVDPEGPRSIHGLTPGSYAEIRVTDNGTGMSREVLERVFEPFFTTKDKGQGTGLGMALIYGIAAGAGGTALAESTPGKGTTVRVLLPRTEEEVAAAEPEASGPPPNATGAKILVVEDEPAVRRLLERILGGHGYDVVSAAHPGEALELAEAGDIDVLLTDIVMPGMPGTRLAKQLASRRPGLRVVFMTGYTDRPDELPSGAPVLLKPFDADELLRVVAMA